MNPKFFEIQVGDIVLVIDKHSRDLEAHFIQIESIEQDKKWITDTNPTGMVCYGTDLQEEEYGDDYVTVVNENTYMHHMQSTSYVFTYTGDNAAIAMDTIQLQLEKLGFIVLDVEILNEKRACRNAFGKQVSEEEFDSYGIDDDEMWFDDYDFTIQVDILNYIPEIEDMEEYEEKDHYFDRKFSNYYGTLDLYLAVLNEEYER